MEKVVVIGGGVMGSALALYLGHNGQGVNLWGTQWDNDFIREMKEIRRNSQHDVGLTDNISLFYHNQLKEAFEGTRLVIIAVISKGMESISRAIAPYLNENHIILSVTKGLDEKSLNTMSNIIDRCLPEKLREKVSIIKLGGPIIAMELAKCKYTEAVFASKDLDAAGYAASLFRSSKFKSNISHDIGGVDLCAAFKNSYAIAMGIMEGLEEGMNNPKAALMARGAIEMANIVEAYGGSRDTALGIAGVGDYYVTSQGGRNGRFGKLLGQGKTIEEALEVMDHQTVEGLAITQNGYKFLMDLEAQGKINMKEETPLFMETYKILYEGKDVRAAVDSYWEGE